MKFQQKTLGEKEIQILIVYGKKLKKVLHVANTVIYSLVKN